MIKRNKSQEVCIGLTYGDPAGVGPEIVFKTLSKWTFNFKPVLVLAEGNSPPEKKTNFKLGKPSKYTGLYSYNCLKKLVQLAKKNKVKAIITGPVSKEAISSTGRKFIGQTEEIAKLCNLSRDRVIMLFAARDFRLALFTRHIPLKTVSNQIKTVELESFICLLHEQLIKWFKIENPKIAILGLNPHAGENGIIGSEEKRIISPLIKKLKKSGVNIFGPFSPDGMMSLVGQKYLKKEKQAFDVYVSMYHDQALPMFKAVCGMDGVNVTLGLPFLRVSVDHGTGFDIAGKNKASNKGLISAINLLEELITN